MCARKLTNLYKLYQLYREDWAEGIMSLALEAELN